MRNYLDELKINKYNLEEEWITHNDKAMYWAEQAVKAHREYKEVELERDILMARLYKKHRSALESEIEERVTDKMVEAEVKLDPEYKEICERLIAAEETSGIMDAAKWKFIARKDSLERIHDGIVTGLFSDPTEGKIAERRETQEKIRDNLRRGR